MPIILLALFIFSLNARGDDYQNYQDAIFEFNKELRSISTDSLSCPGFFFVRNCGNGLCEPHKGESENSCAADCVKAPVASYNFVTLCTGYDEVQIPANEEEVRDLVLKAIFEGKKVKAIGARHSATEVMCSEGVAISMEKLTKVHGIERIGKQLVVNTQPGITVYELSKWLDEKGYALFGQPHMGFRDVTIGGAIATGSHGSTPTRTGVISNIVEAMTFIDGQGKFHSLQRNDANNSDEFKALSASLGMLGIATSIKLKIEPQFNLHTKVTYHGENIIFKDNGIMDIVKDCDYGQLNWFPGKKKFAKTCGVRTNKPAEPWASNVLLKPKLSAMLVKPFKQILQLGACHNWVMCAIENIRYLQFKWQPPFVKQKGKGQVHTDNVVGKSHEMVSSHLTEYQQGFFQMDWEIAIPEKNAQAALMAIKQHVDKNNTCLPLVGVFIRYAPIEDKALLAHTVASGGDWKAGDRAVFFEMPVYIPVGFSQERFDEYEKQFKDFALMLVEKFGGRPHFAKNRDWMFDLAVKNNLYGDNLDKFKRVKQKFDPMNLFSNQLSARLGLDLVVNE